MIRGPGMSGRGRSGVVIVSAAMRMHSGKAAGLVSVERAAPAKVNLALSVGGPEPAGSVNAGYHRIATWMVCVDLCDEVRLRRLEPGQASRYVVGWAADAPRKSVIDWPVEQDLAARAHRLVEARVGRELAVEIGVSKRIPVGAGLGGGSSDAAAVLVGLDELFGLGLSEGVVCELSGRLGSDVAFFADMGPGSSRAGAAPGIVSGFGGRVERVPRIGAEVVLVMPPFGCSTAAVYAAYDQLLWGHVALDASVRRQSRPTVEANGALVRLLVRRAVEHGRIDAGECFNALTAPAAHVEPRVAGVIEGVTAASGVQAHLSGSGSCVFVVCGLGEGTEVAGRVEAGIARDARLAGCVARVCGLR